jgi:hypothetical protein
MSKHGKRQLTQEAEDERGEFEREYGIGGNCSCHLSPPCHSCLHPGNPRNQEEDESCWEFIYPGNIAAANRREARFLRSVNRDSRTTLSRPRTLKLGWINQIAEVCRVHKVGGRLARKIAKLTARGTYRRNGVEIVR